MAEIARPPTAVHALGAAIQAQLKALTALPGAGPQLCPLSK
jgi:hypothetical protein